MHGFGAVPHHKAVQSYAVLQYPSKQVTGGVVLCCVYCRLVTIYILKIGLPPSANIRGLSAHVERFSWRRHLASRLSTPKLGVGHEHILEPLWLGYRQRQREADPMSEALILVNIITPRAETSPSFLGRDTRVSLLGVGSSSILGQLPRFQVWIDPGGSIRFPRLIRPAPAVRQALRVAMTSLVSCKVGLMWPS